jgi:hypothetical protein
MQDVDSGGVVAVSREFSDPAKDSKDAPKDFHQLAASPLFRGISLAALGAGQLLLQGGKRAPNHQLLVGRAKASLNPQNYSWQMLRSPLLAEDFAEVRARLGSLPPASLRPRYLAEHLHVLPIDGVESAEFDEANQSIEIMVRDRRGEIARVHHPYQWRGREGCEALLDALHAVQAGTASLRFIAGQVKSAATGLTIYPITLVFSDGSAVYGVQPCIDRHKGSGDKGSRGSSRDAQSLTGAPDTYDPTEKYHDDLLSWLGELLIVGLRRADASLSRHWQELAKHGEAIGYDRLVQPVAKLANELATKLSSTAWSMDGARRSSLQLAVLARLASDLTANRPSS